MLNLWVAEEVKGAEGERLGNPKVKEVIRERQLDQTKTLGMKGITN